MIKYNFEKFDFGYQMSYTRIVEKNNKKNYISIVRRILYGEYGLYANQ